MEKVMFLGKYRDRETINSIILDIAQKRRQVVYGQQSVNAQLPKSLNRKTKDYDIYTNDSKGSAEELKEELNKEYGSKKFVVTPAIHKGTYKVKDVDGEDIADYTQSTKKPKSKGILGVRYASLNYQKHKLTKSMKDVNSSFRHEKDKDTLIKIKEGTKKIW